MFLYRNACKEKNWIEKITKYVVEVELLGLNGCWEVIDEPLGLNEVEKSFGWNEVENTVE